MGRNRDNAPVKNSCPFINEIISAIQSADWSEAYWTKGELEGKMEEIRRMNEQLRDWGNEQYQRAEDNEREMEIQSSKIEELNEDISNLQDELNTLKSELDESQG